MAWSYSAPMQNTGYVAGDYELRWDNSFTLNAVLSEAVEIRLKLTVSTGTYYEYPYTRYPEYTDTAVYNGTTVQIYGPYTPQPNKVREVEFALPLSWLEKDVSFTIAGRTLTINLAAGAYMGASSVSASNGSFGADIPISITRTASQAVHTLTVSCAGITKTLLTKSSKVTATWTPSVSEYAPKITTASSAKATITCKTFISGSEVGSSTKEITVSFKRDDVKPTLSVSVTDPAGYKTTYGRFVAGKSTYKVTATNTFKYSATLKSISITANGKTYTTNPATTGTVNADYKKITVKVTDSRGISSDTVTYTPEIYSYQQPTVDVLELYRCQADGTKDDGGSYIRVKAKATYTSLGGRNSVTIAAATKRKDAQSYNAKDNIPSNSLTIISSGGTKSVFTPDYTHELKFTATDALGGKGSTVKTLASQKWAMKFRPDGNGVAFGKAAEYDNVLELPAGWRIKIGDQYWPS